MLSANFTEGARIDIEVGYARFPLGVGSGEGAVPPHFFHFLGVSKCVFGAFSGPSRVFVSAV